MSLFRGDKARDPTTISKMHAHCGVLTEGLHPPDKAVRASLENFLSALELIVISKGFDDRCQKGN